MSTQNADFCCDCGQGCNNGKFAIELLGKGQCGGFADLLCFDDVGFALGGPGGSPPNPPPTTSECDYVPTQYFTGFKLRVQYGSYEDPLNPGQTVYEWSEVRATVDTTIGEAMHLEVEQGTGPRSRGIVFQWDQAADGTITQSGAVGPIALVTDNTIVTAHTSSSYIRQDAYVPPDPNRSMAITLTGGTPITNCLDDAKAFCNSVNLAASPTLTLWDGSTVNTHVPVTPIRLVKYYARRPGGFAAVIALQGSVVTDGAGNSTFSPLGPNGNVECFYSAVEQPGSNVFPVTIQSDTYDSFLNIADPNRLLDGFAAYATQVKLAFVVPKWCLKKDQAQIVSCGKNYPGLEGHFIDFTSIPGDRCFGVGMGTQASNGRTVHCHSVPAQDGGNQIGVVTNADPCHTPGGCTGAIWLYTYTDVPQFGWLEVDPSTCGDCTLICANLAP